MSLITRPTYMNRLRELRDHHLIKVVTGVRRCGKSTLLQMFADELRADGVGKKQIQFYNFEDPDVYTLGDWKQIYDHIKAKLLPDKMNYLFLDEVQNIAEFERLVDGLFIKKNCDVYVTGSNAMLLSGELATLLTGRYLELKMYPFSFSEYTRFLDKNKAELEQSNNPPKLTKTESLAEFLYNGGLPEACKLLSNSQLTADMFTDGVLRTIIEKDIFVRHRVNNKQAFEKIVSFIFDSVGSLISPRSIADTLTSMGDKVDKETTSNYLSYLTEALLVYKVPRFEIKGKGLLQTLDKYYVVDSAFRRVRLNKRPDVDLGHLLENTVYFELLRRNKEVYVGKLRDAEVDFIAIDWDGYASYYQVAQTTFDPTVLARELRPLQAIRDSNPKFIITMDADHDPVYDGIHKIKATDWLLAV